MKYTQYTYKTYIDLKGNNDTSCCNLLWSHPSYFHFLFSQCTYLKPWTSAATQSKIFLKRQWNFFYYVLRYRLCMVHMGATGTISSGHPVGWPHTSFSHCQRRAFSKAIVQSKTDYPSVLASTLFAVQNNPSECRLPKESI